MDGTGKRCGALVRQRRIAIGFSSRRGLARASGVSERLIADVESGARENFREATLDRLAEALGWPAGSIQRIAVDATFIPPAPAGVELMFQPPDFDRAPVEVPVEVIETSMAALARGDSEELRAAAVMLQAPYVVRLMEDNCTPGLQLHPAVRPGVEAWLAAAGDAVDPELAGYLQWISGDGAAAGDREAGYRDRWMAARRTRDKRCLVA